MKILSSILAFAVISASVVALTESPSFAQKGIHFPRHSAVTKHGKAAGKAPKGNKGGTKSAPTPKPEPTGNPNL